MTEDEEQIPEEPGEDILVELGEDILVELKEIKGLLVALLDSSIGIRDDIGGWLAYPYLSELPTE